MIVGNILQAICHELSLLPEVLGGLRRRNFSALAALRFLRLRILAPEQAPADGMAMVTPEGVRLRMRRDIVMYQTLFLLDEYRSVHWGPGLAAQPSPLVLDVGANLGFFSALCLSICPAARVRCFELVPECGQVIEQRLRDMGRTDFQIQIGAVGAWHGGSLAIHYDLPFTSTNRVDRVTGSLNAKVPCISLDGWAERQVNLGAPYLVKIDVEGAEEGVLSGGSKTVCSAEWILIELHQSRDLLQRLLQSHRVIEDIPYSATEWICILKKK